MIIDYSSQSLSYSCQLLTLTRSYIYSYLQYIVGINYYWKGLTLTLPIDLSSWNLKSFTYYHVPEFRSTDNHILYRNLLLYTISLYLAITIVD